ncbi:PspA/IM30 family protein [Clostridium lacusfryxellense]|uniref:PspA/IM30 family protein n=1 Tax=Clostridium lacusfryxellense TaxID=205328 RepID=UPI001C0C3110|nr:PspA/IM30 family protein [Clostridium lacusfryxellense]MBU3114257.1 PspA/IM30 family protein [Clostridium lacusfryxellense]
MGIFDRIGNSFKAGVNKIMDANEDTEALIDQAIRDKDEALNEARTKSAVVFGNVKRLEKEMISSKEDMSNWESKIKLAIEKGNDELAGKAIAKQKECEATCVSLTKSYGAAKITADNLKKSLLELGDDLKDLRGKRDGLIARLKTAEAAQQVNAITANVKTKGNSIDLDRLERKIEETESLAEGLGELKVDSLEDEFEALEKTSVSDDLAAYKAKYAKQ